MRFTGIGTSGRDGTSAVGRTLGSILVVVELEVVGLVVVRLVVAGEDGRLDVANAITATVAAAGRAGRESADVDNGGWDHFRACGCCGGGGGRSGADTASGGGTVQGWVFGEELGLAG